MASTEQWEPVQRLRTYEQVMAQIEQRILDGRLKPETTCPASGTLAALLGVSRPSLRESLRVLEALGVVDIRRGGGPDGGAALVQTPGTGLVNLLKLQTRPRRISARTMWSRPGCPRRVVACGGGGPSERRRPPRARRDPRQDGRPRHRPANSTDWMPRSTCGSRESTGNALTAHFMSSLRTAIHHQMVEPYAELDDWRETAKIVRREHRDILAAIIDRDEVAGRTTDAHRISTISTRPTNGSGTTPSNAGRSGPVDRPRLRPVRLSTEIWTTR